MYRNILLALIGISISATVFARVDSDKEVVGHWHSVASSLKIDKMSKSLSAHDADLEKASADYASKNTKLNLGADHKYNSPNIVAKVSGTWSVKSSQIGVAYIELVNDNPKLKVKTLTIKNKGQTLHEVVSNGKVHYQFDLVKD